MSRSIIKQFLKLHLYLTVGIMGCVLAGCWGVYPNFPVQGPNGEWAIILSDSGSYDIAPRSGCLWSLSPEGKPTREPICWGDWEGARVCDWRGDKILFLYAQEVPREEGGKTKYSVAEVDMQGTFYVLFFSQDKIDDAHYYKDNHILYLSGNNLYEINLFTKASKLLQSGVLAFSPCGHNVFVVYADGGLGWLGKERLPLRIAWMDETWKTGLSMLAQWHLATDSTGRYIAINIPERPPFWSKQEKEQSQTALYLIDLQALWIDRVMTNGFSPSFSPDRKKLAFVVSRKEPEPQEVFIYDMRKRKSVPVGHTNEAVWVSWGRKGLLVAIRQNNEEVLYLIPNEEIFSDHDARIPFPFIGGEN